MTARPSSLRSLQQSILENLARFEILTARLLSMRIYGDDKHSHITSVNKAINSLHRKHLVNRIYFRPHDYKGRGNLPNASGLSEDGVILAETEWPATHPKEFPRTHSPHTIEHDLNRARSHIEIFDLCGVKDWTLGWKKGGKNIVKPDDVFEITGQKTSHFFLEWEEKKKDFQQLYDKLKPYVDNYDSGTMKEGWGFRYYDVLIPMRDEEAMNNVLVHFRGDCNCIDTKFKKLHSRSPYKLRSDILFFTTHQDMLTSIAGPIFHTPTGKTFSFLDMVK